MSNIMILKLKEGRLNLAKMGKLSMLSWIPVKLKLLSLLLFAPMALNVIKMLSTIGWLGIAYKAFIPKLYVHTLISKYLAFPRLSPSKLMKLKQKAMQMA
jgi:hypothetical protein